MAVAESARLTLYVIEWIWTVVVLGIFPSQLIQRGQPLAQPQGGRGDVCSFSQSLGISRCNFGVSVPVFLLPCCRLRAHEVPLELPESVFR